MPPIDERRRWRETIQRAGSRPDGFPPPVTEFSVHAPVERDVDIDVSAGNLVRELVRKLGPWLAIATTIIGAIVGAASWFFSAGIRAATIPSKADIDAVSSADMAVHHQTDKRLEQIDIRLERIMTLQEQQAKTLDELKAELKEQRLKPRNPK